MIKPAIALVGAALLAPATLPSTSRAATPHRHHRRAPAPARSAPPPTAAPGFYPETVEGGVPGNLSFNNQLRKFSDPLNANGGR